MLSPTDIEEFKDFSRLLSDFPVLFKADLIFKDFSGKPSNSSTFQACANPDALDTNLVAKMMTALLRL